MRAFWTPTEQRSISDDASFRPRSDDFDARVKASFDRQAFMKTLGARLVSVEPGRAVLEMPFDERLGQQHGFHHAGATTSVLDSACGYAAYSLMAPDKSVVTVEFKVNLLAPAKGERFRFEGQVVRPGRTLTVCEGRAFAIAGDAETLVATMSATLMAIEADEAD